MGLLEDIGETIGGALGALADFIGDAFGSLVRAVGQDLLGIGSDGMAGAAKAIESTDDQVYKDVERTHKKIEAPIMEGFMHDVNELAEKHSEVDPDTAYNEVMDLWEKIRVDAGAATVGAIVAEAATLGQVDGVMQSYQMADRISGASAFAAKVASMRYDALWLTSYQRHLNAVNPNMIAGSSDLVRFALREVWDPTRRPELVKEDAPGDYYLYMQQQGFTPERARDFWAAHWDLPSVSQLNEMLHRGVIDEADWDRFIKYNDYDPEVRPWLKEISFTPYTRVDARRMWDMGILDDGELKQSYKDIGYDDEHADKMTLWTKVYVQYPDLVARYKNGWISQDEVMTGLTTLGMPPDRAQWLFETKFKAVEEERTSTERNLTKAEIVKGVKLGVISATDGVELLMDMGYSEDESIYILTINVEALTGSPHTWSEFQEIVNKDRKLRGREIKKIPPVIPDLEKKITDLEKKIEESKKDEEKKTDEPLLTKQLNLAKRQHRNMVKEYRKI